MQSQFALTYNLNGGTSTQPETESVYYASLATKVADPVKDGHTFLHWNTAEDGNGDIWDFDTTTMPFAEVTLHAQWQVNATDATNTNTNSNTSTLPTTGLPLFEAGVLGLIIISAGIFLIKKKR
ncbi:InlB B-repeat-containing protein [Culicoidibacter larvae]|uniref:LPXTG cell wall anchor domain-containing protein n=1 Tax=Culicoidibacter larvae TaxID=2579976 RepID=A0A5R8QBL9_9FIRM|nr:hypothetical protein FEZ08_07380 [Culicoidibacter larvae]